jgi:hypothetical protein
MSCERLYKLQPGLTVDSSAIHDRGTFAISNLPKATLLLVIGGYIMTLQEEAELPRATRDAGLQITSDLVLSSIPSGGGGFIGGIGNVNHSCEPNAGFCGQIFLVAMRDIIRGEEITFDYAMCLGDGPDAASYRLECHCGSAKCRGWITDRDWRMSELQTRYRGFFQPYLQTRIEERGLNY